MTGPEHYKIAEQLLRDLADAAPGAELIRAVTSVAQLHVGLSIAAAIALTRTEGLLSRDAQVRDAQAWFEAAGTKKSKDGAA